MADTRAYFDVTDELEEDIGQVDVLPDSYGQQAEYTEEQFPRLDETQFAALQQQLAQQQAFAAIPDQVKRFIVRFHESILSNNVQEIRAAYESGWNKLTDQFYSKTEWPDAEVISPLVRDDQVFLVLYRELWYRHVFSKLSPNIDDRFHSYENSCELFNYLLNSEGPVALNLPDSWLWDIIDEFLYQFQSHAIWRSKVKSKNEDELNMLMDTSVWSSYSVLNVLYSLIQKSRINEQLAATARGENPEDVAGEYGSLPLYRTLGYFSIIGLLRVHVLLGDYTLALTVMDHIELNKKAFFTKVTAAHVTVYYYVGFSYLMLGRYTDAIKTFSNILVFISRIKNYTRSYQVDAINKQADRMYALLAIAVALCPTRLDENIHSNLRERYGDQLAKMSKGEEGLAAFEELFLYACPKFILANSPPYPNPEELIAYIEAPPQEPAQRHLALFMTSVRAQLSNPTLRSFLKLYSSLGTSKLAAFLDKQDEDEVFQQLLVQKQSLRALKHNEGGLLEGDIVSTSDLDFVIDDNMIQVAESKTSRRYGTWFLRSLVSQNEVLAGIQSKPLPVKQKAAAGAQAQAQGGDAQRAQATGTGAGAGAQRTGAPRAVGGPAWGAQRRA